METNSSEIIPIKGMKIGCTPSESFRLSTLECFYDQSCIDLIQQYTNYTSSINSTNSPSLLSPTMSRFPINTTIAELINDLFIEQWATTINYSSYYEQCSPLICSYTYNQQFNPMYTITFLLGLQGGLIIVLKWICPKIIQIIDKIYHHRKKRMNIVEPASPLEMTPADNMNRNVRNTTCDVELMPTNITSQYVVFIFISLIIYNSLH
jgi:hypothetical protein